MQNWCDCKMLNMSNVQGHPCRRRFRVLRRVCFMSSGCRQWREPGMDKQPTSSVLSRLLLQNL